MQSLRDLALRGMSPEAMALSIALGFVLGVFPVPGCPTLLCALAALILRLNGPAVQAVNYLVYPLQLALFAPFMRLGGRLFPAPAAISRRSCTAEPGGRPSASWSPPRTPSPAGFASAHRPVCWSICCWRAAFAAGAAWRTNQTAEGLIISFTTAPAAHDDHDCRSRSRGGGEDDESKV